MDIKDLPYVDQQHIAIERANRSRGLPVGHKVVQTIVSKRLRFVVEEPPPPVPEEQGSIMDWLEANQ